MREICMSGSTRGREGRGFTPLPPVLLYRSSVAIPVLVISRLLSARTSSRPLRCVRPAGFRGVAEDR